MNMKIDINNMKINYDVIGDGPIILFIHGYGLHKESLKYSTEKLFVNRNFKRIYLDLPGMGKSSYNDSIQNSDDMLSVLMLFIKNVIKDRVFAIVGESYGGYLARGILSKLPNQVIGLALIVPVIKSDYTKRNLPNHFTAFEDTEFMNTLKKEDKDDLDYLVIKNEYVIKRTLTEIFEPMNSDDTLLIRIKEKGYGFSFDVDNLIKKYHKPTLFILGKHDSVTGYIDAFDILKNYHNASFVVLDNAGHNLHIEQEELFNNHMITWLNLL